MYTHLDNRTIKGSETLKSLNSGLIFSCDLIVLMSSNSIGTGNHQRASINVYSRKVVGRLYSIVSLLSYGEVYEKGETKLTRPIEIGTHLTECTSFSNVPKLFGWHKSLYIFNKNMFQALKLGSYFAFPCIWNILKEQLFTASGT